MPRFVVGKIVTVSQSYYLASVAVASPVVEAFECLDPAVESGMVSSIRLYDAFVKH